MKLTSNIQVVIARLEELQAGYPAAIRRALAPEWWTPQLKGVAEKTLTAQVWAMGVQDELDRAARTRFQRLVPQIVATVMGSAKPAGALFQMWLPPNAVADIDFDKAAKFAGDQWTPLGRAKKFAMPDPAGEENLQATRQAVLDWVTYEKRRDERDRHADGTLLSDEEIAERVETILGLRPAFHQRSAAMDADAAALRGAIQAWLDGESATPGGTPVAAPAVNRPRGRGGVTNDQARQWLGAVLAAWVSFVRVRLRDRIEAELKRLHAKVKAEQPGLI
jgi:hypothetical protein